MHSVVKNPLLSPSAASILAVPLLAVLQSVNQKNIRSGGRLVPRVGALLRYFLLLHLSNHSLSLTITL